MPKIIRLFRHWRESPPAHRLLALRYQYSHDEKVEQVEQEPPATFQGASEGTTPFEALPEAVQDWLKVINADRQN